MITDELTAEAPAEVVEAVQPGELIRLRRIAWLAGEMLTAEELGDHQRVNVAFERLRSLRPP